MKNILRIFFFGICILSITTGFMSINGSSTFFLQTKNKCCNEGYCHDQPCSEGGVGVITPTVFPEEIVTCEECIQLIAFELPNSGQGLYTGSRPTWCWYSSSYSGLYVKFNSDGSKELCDMQVVYDDNGNPNGHMSLQNCTSSGIEQ